MFENYNDLNYRMADQGEGSGIQGGAGGGGNAGVNLVNFHISKLEDVCAAMAETIDKNNEALNTLSDAISAKYESGGDKLFQKFSSHKPSEYNGNVDPVELEEWGYSMEQLFDVLDVPANKKVKFATHYLKKEAGDWWRMSKEALKVPGYSWDKLKKDMNKRFFPQELQWAKK